MDLPNSFDNLATFQQEVEELNLSYILPGSDRMGNYIEDINLKIRQMYDTDIEERKQFCKTIALEW